MMLTTVLVLACGLLPEAQPTALPTVPAQATVVPQGSEQGNPPGAQATQPPAASPSGPSACEHGSLAQARAVLQAAVQDYQASGREQALKDFNERKPPYASGDLYVVCLGEDHKITALGAFPLLVGTSADALKDPNGNPIGQVVWEAANVQPQGEVPFHWQNPLTGQEESKILVYQKLSQDVCGVAADQP
jgi:hypothetical protein